jgi:hypothetical protein
MISPKPEEPQEGHSHAASNGEPPLPGHSPPVKEESHLPENSSPVTEESHSPENSSPVKEEPPLPEHTPPMKPEEILAKPDVESYLSRDMEDSISNANPIKPENNLNTEMEVDNDDPNPIKPENNPESQMEVSGESNASIKPLPKDENNRKGLRCIPLNRLTEEIMEVDLTECDEPDHVNILQTIFELRQHLGQLVNQAANKDSEIARLKDHIKDLENIIKLETQERTRLENLQRDCSASLAHLSSTYQE